MLEYTKYQTGESFKAMGVGLAYEYDQSAKCLRLLDRHSQSCILEAQVALYASNTIKSFVELVEKTTQIQALLASGHSTYNITDIFSHERLAPYLETTLNFATMALFLELKEFNIFGEQFCEHYDLKAFTITPLTPASYSVDMYRITVETHHGNVVDYQAGTIHTCLNFISRQIISDLLLKETKNNFQHEAHVLLSASSTLSTLSLIMNHEFSAWKKLKKPLTKATSKTFKMAS